jgi:beta-1,3-glucuronyltransferase
MLKLKKSFFPHVVQKSEERLYLITPTYPRYEQIAELTRLGQTLQHVQNIVWIVAEDAKQPTEEGSYINDIN